MRNHEKSEFDTFPSPKTVSAPPSPPSPGFVPRKAFHMSDRIAIILICFKTEESGGWSCFRSIGAWKMSKVIWLAVSIQQQNNVNDTQRACHLNLWWQNSFETTSQHLRGRMAMENFSQACWIARELIPVVWLLVDWVQWLQPQLRKPTATRVIHQNSGFSASHAESVEATNCRRMRWQSTGFWGTPFSDSTF